MAWFRNRTTDPTGDPPTLQGGERIAFVVLEGADTGASLLVAPPEAEIGRGDETVSADGKLLLRDRSVSTFQARLRHAKGAWLLEHDSAATNPTLVNGEAIQRKVIAPGDRIRMGRVMLEVRSPATIKLARPAAREEHTEVIRAGALLGMQLQASREAWGHLVIVKGPG